MAGHVEDPMAMQYIGVYPYPIAPWPLAGSEDAPKDIDILNIRDDNQELDLASEVKSKLQISRPNGLRSFPSTLLWDEQGLDGFDAMTADKARLLENHVDDIAMSLLPGTILIEIGAGSPTKTRLLLEAMESHHKIVDYYALDMDRGKLEKTLKNLDPARFNYVRCHGLLGTYDDGRRWIAKYENKQRPVCVLSLAASVSDFGREEATAFWRQWSDLLTVNNKFNSNNARVILDIEHCKESDRVVDGSASNDQLVHKAIDKAIARLGSTAFEPSEWTVKGEWDAAGKTYTQYLVPHEDLKFEDIQLTAGEKIFLSHSHKYNEDKTEQFLQGSNLKVVQRYMSDDGSYGRSMSSRRVYNTQSQVTKS